MLGDSSVNKLKQDLSRAISNLELERVAPNEV
jgi:hypothetical protein